MNRILVGKKSLARGRLIVWEKLLKPEAMETKRGGMGGGDIGKKTDLPQGNPGKLKSINAQELFNRFGGDCS